MVAHSEHINQLIAHYLSGEALPDEAVQLDDWLELSVDNQRYFAQMQKVYRQSTAMAEQPTYNADTAWNKVKEAMHRPKPQAKAIPLYRRYAAQLAAAVVALVVGIPFLLYYTGVFLPVTTTELASNETIGKAYVLADSSHVVLNRNSVVTYSSTYGKHDRNVKLEGEAFFEVAHREGKPFIVEANGVSIEDIGTAFNVKAYDSTNTVEVYVETGSVRFYTSCSNSITLVAGQVGVYNKSSDTFSIKEMQSSNVIAYKTKHLVFVDTPLKDVVKELGLVYGVQVELSNVALGSRKITVSFSDESIESVLDIIAETLNLNVEKGVAGFRLKDVKCAH